VTDGIASVPESGTDSDQSAASQREMLRLVSELYYVRGLGQPEIATLTGFSISKVSRLLATARAAGVVRISVEGAPQEPAPLARALSAALGASRRRRGLPRSCRRTARSG
jgi:DNA-binding transcriptional regulator LsrR (DeoR family)